MRDRWFGYEFGEVFTCEEDKARYFINAHVFCTVLGTDDRGVLVETLFLAYDHNKRKGDRLIFRTTVHGGAYSGYSAMCGSKKEARKIHDGFARLAEEAKGKQAAEMQMDEERFVRNDLLKERIARVRKLKV